MKKTLFLILLIALAGTNVLAQEKNVTESELKAEVPELTKYHKVIYKLWHVLWPKKDVNGIAQIYEDIKNGAYEVKNAKLPGILRDKQGTWNENVNKLTTIVEELGNAIKAGDSVLILKKAEDLHTQYEKLVRIVKPVVKELDEFHQVLYVLYHYYVPEYNVEKIKEVAPDLKHKVERLKEAKLPERLKAKENEFKKRVSELEKEVVEFVRFTEGKFDKKNITQKMEKVHSKYQAVERLFE